MAKILRFGQEEYDSGIMDTVMSIIEKADIHKEHGYVFLDIGAHYGAWTLGLADRFRKSKTIIHSFDVFEEYLDSIDLSIRLNNFQNATFQLHTAVVTTASSDEGIVSIPSNDFLREFFSSRLTSLDRLYADQVFPCPSFIRFDADVSELDAILGAEKVLLECFPIVVIAIPCRSLVKSYVKLLERHGYFMGWLVGTKCAICKKENWYEGTAVEPMLIGVPWGQENLLTHWMITAIPQSQYFDNYYFMGGLLEVDHYEIQINYPNGQSENVSHLNESIHKNYVRCNSSPPEHTNYIFRLVERYPFIEQEVYVPDVADIDPVDPIYPKDLTSGVYYVFNRSMAQQRELIDYYYNDVNRIRFVSAYYDISRSSWTGPYTRRNADYFRYFKPYLYLDINLVLFLDENLFESLL